jgi:HEAT repeat protein
VLQTLTNTLADADPQVRAAAARGIGALCATLARPDLVKQRLDRIASDPDESVRRTRDEVLAGISG